MGRRRKGSATTTNTDDSKPKPVKNILATEEVKTVSPEEQAKLDAAKAKRAERTKAATQASIRDGILELQQWLDDQLRTGLGDFISDCSNRCRQIAARLVDAKAQALASRLDELPSRILSLTPEQQPDLVIRELGQITILLQAWLNNPEDPDCHRHIATAENREALLANPDCLRVNTIWEVVGERISTRRDGLVSHASWLLDIATDGNAAPRFALLLDFFPAALGKRSSSFVIGSRMCAELAYYPSRFPSRAILLESSPLSPQECHPPPMTWSVTAPKRQYVDSLAKLPWQEQCPCLLGAGRVVYRKTRHQNDYWWQSADQTQQLPLSNGKVPDLLLGSALNTAFVLYNGQFAELLSAQTTKWGVLACA